MINIRRARQPDAGQVALLCEQLGYPASVDDISQRLRTMSENTDHAIYVAEVSEGKVVGWVHVYSRRLLVYVPHAAIGGLIVDEAFRGAGIGRLLMQKAEGWARGQGLQVVQVRSGADRQGAHRFYRNVGYGYVKTSSTFRKTL
jgi:GNAT superfamily N-acetyltransferase